MRTYGVTVRYFYKWHNPKQIIHLNYKLLQSYYFEIISIVPRRQNVHN